MHIVVSLFSWELILRRGCRILCEGTQQEPGTCYALLTNYKTEITGGVKFTEIPVMFPNTMWWLYPIIIIVILYEVNHDGFFNFLRRRRRSTGNLDFKLKNNFDINKMFLFCFVSEKLLLIVNFCFCINGEFFYFTNLEMRSFCGNIMNFLIRAI